MVIRNTLHPRQLQDANSELIRLNKEQAEAATSALRLARSEQQIKALQESDRLRRELLANVSHELRTPLGTILTESTGATSLRSAADVQEALETIAAEARRLAPAVVGLIQGYIVQVAFAGGDIEQAYLDSVRTLLRGL